MSIAASLSVGLAFAACALFGMRLALRWCVGRVPFNDGPPRATAPVWTCALAAGIIGVTAWVHAADAGSLATLAVATTALAACVIADQRCGAIPDVFLLPALTFALLASVLRHDATALVAALLASLPFAAGALLSHGRGLGWGDVKLAALGGAFLGAPVALIALGSSCAAAWLVAATRSQTHRPVAFAPYAAAAFGVAVAAGPVLR